MRVLLWNENKQAFYQGPDLWTSNPDSAKHFENSLSAALFARDNNGDHLEVCLDFGNPEYDVYLPVRTRLNRAEGQARDEGSSLVEER